VVRYTGERREQRSLEMDSGESSESILDAENVISKLSADPLCYHNKVSATKTATTRVEIIK
jgi:hypothetical protein